ncbi:MFS transporter [Mesorhizobium sp. NBSH29]|uniref:MFS transporter n=1 Tax=Mesorhizobium sp. NBSH29 TaxID=2654249 RepID=UPI00189697CF|nr:MFS transporter [Mesorhizobium sp. NBSH29]QPC85910.1 MFS transporter [Mesorhizobium sp. NBSH29]
MDLTVPAAITTRARWAVGAMFFANGFLTGSWAPQIPVLVARLGITSFTLGFMILGFGAGAVLSMAWAGHLIARHGSQWVVRMFGVACVFGLLLVALAPNVALTACALFVFGGMIGAMDVAMNANAVTVERKLLRAIMSSSHGFWSLGGFFGGAMGGLVIQRFGHLPHAVLVTLLAGALVAMAYREIAADIPVAQEHRKFVLPRSPAVYLLGLMALLSMNSEGAVLDWAALYLRDEMGSTIATAGFAFAAFSGAMAAMRFMGDGVRNKFGAVVTFRISSLVAATGMLIAGLSPWPWLVILAFAVGGLGIANMIPILFSAAGNQPGLASGAAISVVTLMGYSGILVSPSLIGFVGQYVGFAPVFVGVALLLLVVFLMAGLTRAADFDHGPKPPQGE